MKRILTVLIIISVLSISIAGCSSSVPGMDDWSEADFELYDENLKRVAYTKGLYPYIYLSEHDDSRTFRGVYIGMDVEQALERYTFPVGYAFFGEDMQTYTQDMNLADMIAESDKEPFSIAVILNEQFYPVTREQGIEKGQVKQDYWIFGIVFQHGKVEDVSIGHNTFESSEVPLY